MPVHGTQPRVEVDGTPLKANYKKLAKLRERLAKRLGIAL